MGTIIQMADHKRTAGGWASGAVRCGHCGHEWTGSFPLPLRDSLECPECRLFYGWPMYPMMDCGQPTLTCQTCDGYTFVVRLQGDVLCTHCGNIQEIPPC